MNKKVILYSQNCPTNGLMGFVNCFKKETSVDNVYAVLITGNAPPFKQESSFYKSQVKKNLFCNVYEDGQWGRYRHLLMPKIKSVLREHSYLHLINTDDFSSLQWVEGPLNNDSVAEESKNLVNIHCSTINFKESMISGKIIPHINSDKGIDKKYNECFEYSGCLTNDKTKRVMGIADSQTISTMVMADTSLMWEIPDEWSYEDAATVPIAFSTVLYALLCCGRIKRGQSILIHCGAGDIGEAAINVASYLGCIIFTTVDTQEKRDFIINNFAQINEKRIGDSKSASFEQTILKETNGRGVDFVLNSLTDNKFEASIRCLANNGTFLETEKSNLINDNGLGSLLLKKPAKYVGVMLERLIYGNTVMKQTVTKLVTNGIQSGYIKPLVRTTFSREKVEEAFKFMSTGNHIGKVVVKIRNDDQKEEPFLVPSVPKFCCSSTLVYVIIGGLGGFGLELTDWLIKRGVKKIILTSRSGLKNGYQAYRLQIFKRSGADIYIRKDNTSSESGCKNLLSYAQSLGGVEGIFNLAAVLKDGLSENQTEEKFKISLMSKAHTTRFLDDISRNVCPKLKYFVVFSSLTCGKGNPGQTNYGLANSVMETICHKRKTDGYPALAIQWGPIGDVGLISNITDYNESVIAGVIRQKISNCLEVLDNLLTQNETVACSMILAEKGGTYENASTVDAIMNIMGVTDLKCINKYTPLPELGMDSIMLIEIRQMLEREYKVFLTLEDLMKMSLAKYRRIIVENP